MKRGAGLTMTETRVVNGVRCYRDKDGHWRRRDTNQIITVHENDTNNRKGNTDMTEDQELKALQEHTAELKEEFERIVVEKINEALETVAETVYHALSEKLAEEIDNYIHSEVGEAVNELSEAVDGIENLVVTLADTLSPEAREKFYAKARAAAEQQPRPEQGEYPGSKNQDGSHGIPVETQAKRNRDSLKPSGGITAGIQKLGEGIVDDNNALKDEMEAREKARKDLFHRRLMEFVEGKDRHPTNQGVLSRPGVISED
jgi:hypothetical protein